LKTHKPEGVRSGLATAEPRTVPFGNLRSMVSEELFQALCKALPSIDLDAAALIRVPRSLFSIEQKNELAELKQAIKDCRIALAGLPTEGSREFLFVGPYMSSYPSLLPKTGALVTQNGGKLYECAWLEHVATYVAQQYFDSYVAIFPQKSGEDPHTKP
jgi:hypothetical protein